jgi:hypothetical protein
MKDGPTARLESGTAILAVSATGVSPVKCDAGFQPARIESILPSSSLRFGLFAARMAILSVMRP